MFSITCGFEEIFVKMYVASPPLPKVGVLLQRIVDLSLNLYVKPQLNIHCWLIKCQLFVCLPVSTT